MGIVFLPLALIFWVVAKGFPKPLRQETRLISICFLFSVLIWPPSPYTWTGYGALIGFLILYIILIHSIKSVSSHLASRMELRTRLFKEGYRFLAEMGESEDIDQAIASMKNSLIDVVNEFQTVLNYHSLDREVSISDEEISEYIDKAFRNFIYF